MPAVRRILFATDFSKASRKAFTTAVEMAKANGALLTIAHVIVPFTPIVPEQYMGGQTWDTQSAFTTTHARTRESRC
jgi:nucleotide-binding universal stress UspA family protein